MGCLEQKQAEMRNRWTRRRVNKPLNRQTRHMAAIPNAPPVEEQRKCDVVLARAHQREVEFLDKFSTEDNRSEMGTWLVALGGVNFAAGALFSDAQKTPLSRGVER